MATNERYVVMRPTLLSQLVRIALDITPRDVEVVAVGKRGGVLRFGFARDARISAIRIA